MKWLTLKIGGQPLEVHIVRPTDKKLEGNLGLYDPDKNRIYLSNALEPAQREDTLFHELDHAVNQISGANQMIRSGIALLARLPEQDFSDAYEKLEEDFVSTKTPHWHRLLKDLGFVFPKGPTE